MTSYLTKASRDYSFPLITNSPEQDVLSFRKPILELPSSTAVTFNNKLYGREHFPSMLSFAALFSDNHPVGLSDTVRCISETCWDIDFVLLLLGRVAPLGEVDLLHAVVKEHWNIVWL